MRNYVLVVEKSEAISPCKEMLVIPINKVVDKKKIIGTNGSKVEERHKGLQTQKKTLDKTSLDEMLLDKTLLDKMLLDETLLDEPALYHKYIHTHYWHMYSNKILKNCFWVHGIKIKKACM
jgi:hypothetical protein